MKKIFALLLVMALLLSGCGGRGNDSERVSGRVEAPAETQAAEENLSLGRLEGGTYINEYTGYGCTLDSNWTIMSAEELQQMPELAKEAMSGSELAEAIDSMAQFTDFMAENADELLTFNVLYQKVSMEERLANALVSEEALINGILDMQDQMIDAYAQAGITFLGETRTALHTVTNIDGIPYFLLQIYNHQLGSHTVTLTLGSYLEDNTTQMLDLFYSVN